MRRRREKKPNLKAMEFIERNYLRLADRCNRIAPAGEMEAEDVFHETILFVISDARAERVQSDEEFMDYFAWRWRMIAFQTRQDAKQEKKEQYAYYRETKKNTDDE